LAPSSAAQGEGGGFVLVGFSAVVIDPGADVARLVVAVLDPEGNEIEGDTFDIQNPPGMTTGQVGGQAAAPTDVVGDYTIRVHVVDSGGANSNALEATFSVVQGDAVPAVSALSPESAPAGAPSFTLTVTGSGFAPSSSVLWNGTALSTTFVDASTLLASVPSYDLNWGTTAQVTVYTPSPGGGFSNTAVFTITPTPPNPVPAITALSPSTVEAGNAPFTLTVTGSGFTPSSTVHWNSNWLATTFVDGSTLLASVPDYYRSSVGSVQISAYNPSPGGGTSETMPFAVTRPAIAGVTIVALPGNDLAWDPYQRKLYVAVPSSSAVNPNTITVLDPFTGELGASRFAGSEPRLLAISDDGQRLYAALGGASFVNRFGLPELAQDAAIALGRDATYGPYYARDVQVAPAAPGTIAVSLAASGSSGRITIFDDATARPTSAQDASSRFGALQWGADATALYAGNDGYGYHFYTLSVDGAGVALGNDYANTFTGSGATRIHLDAGTGLVYADDGRVVDPASGMVAGSFNHQLAAYYGSSTSMVPDSSLGSAFFAGQTSYGAWATLRSFDLTRFVATGSMTLPYVRGPTSRLVRWGPDGVAFIAGSEVVLVRGAAVLPPSSTPNGVPTVTVLSPARAAAGNGNFRLRVTGSGFVSGSVVAWNENERSTRFVSSTELVAFIPADDIAAAGSATITVKNPEPGGGVSTGVTFDVGP
jgi:hypothetical protein